MPDELTKAEMIEMLSESHLNFVNAALRGEAETALLAYTNYARLMGMLLSGERYVRRFRRQSHNDPEVEEDPDGYRAGDIDPDESVIR